MILACCTVTGSKNIIGCTDNNFKMSIPRFHIADVMPDVFPSLLKLHAADPYCTTLLNLALSYILVFILIYKIIYIHCTI